MIGISLGNNCHVGNNVIVEPDTLLYFAAHDKLGPAARIAEQHNWQLRIEPGFREVVARRM